MAPKKVQTSVKLQIEAGKATPAPPVGPALGQAQINIMEFCKQFNARTSNKEMAGLIITVVIPVFTARSSPSTTRMPQLNAASLETAIKSVKGTARSMGIEVIA